MSIVLDLIVVAIVAVYVFLSAKKGFVRTAIELVGFCVAIYLSLTLSGVLANLTYDKVVEPALVNNITESVDAAAITNISSTVDTIWNSLPSFVSDAAENLGTTKQDLSKQISDGATQNSEQTVKNAVGFVAKPIVVGISKALFFIILFIVLLFLVRILAKSINSAFKLPIVGGINRSLGGVLGLFKGAIIATAICICISVIVNLTKDGFLIFNQSNIDHSYLFKLLCGLNPFYK